MNGKIYCELASAVQARLNCIKASNGEWQGHWEVKIDNICKNYLPSGSGWDNGTKIDLDKSNGEKLVLYGAFHHMDDGGGYDGWTEHTVIVTGSLTSEFDLKITGRDRNCIKEYLADMFRAHLDLPYHEPAAATA